MDIFEINIHEAERQRGELMREMLNRLQEWKDDLDSWEFTLDIEEACEVLEPLLRAALQNRESADSALSTQDSAL